MTRGSGGRAPFHFLGCWELREMLGRRAYDERELLEHLEEVPLDSIYFHTHSCFLREPTLPGGYPNAGGVNLQHDDFLGARQPETQSLLDLTARERPDLLFNMHTGAPPQNYYVRMHRPATERRLEPVYEDLYREVHTALALAGLQGTKDPAIEAANPGRGNALLNLDSALNMHCGVLSVLIESPSHSFAGHSREGAVVRHTADQLLDAQLVAYQAGFRFLADKGGRVRWAPAFPPGR